MLMNIFAVNISVRLFLARMPWPNVILLFSQHVDCKLRIDGLLLIHILKLLVICVNIIYSVISDVVQMLYTFNYFQIQKLITYALNNVHGI